VDKSTGIDAVAAYFGWDVKQTMAFGDGGNDIGMLRHVGCGIAMGNASEEVKQHARYVTDDIDRDGVAKAIERYLE
jgi:hydroxymethylpyrimidine pyrophosphatase-like HAD family hydrolase